MAEALRLIPAKTELMSVEGAGHDLGFKAKTQKKELAPEVVTKKFEEFFPRRPKKAFAGGCDLQIKMRD